MAPDASWELPGWRCFATAGGTIGRVSSAAATAESASPAASLSDVARSYQERGYRPRIRLTPLASPTAPAQAAALGWAEASGAHVMGMRLPRQADVSASDESITWTSEASPVWCAVHLRGHEVPDAAERLALAVSAKGETAYFEATTPDGGAVAAIGLGIVSDRLLGIYDVLTAREHRRAGHARRVMAGLLNWGASLGADEAYLQVATGNDAAIALYRSIGFDIVYTYTYLAPSS